MPQPKNSRILRANRPQQPTVITGVQTRDSFSHPFGVLNSYVPLQRSQYQLYAAIREAVPIMNRAILSLARLIGNCEIEIQGQRIQRELNEFLKEVKVGATQTGLQAFQNQYVDQLLEKGTTWGEIIPNNKKDGIYAVKVAEVSTLELKQVDDNPLELLLCQYQPGKMGPVQLPYQDLLLFTALNPQPSSPYGISLYKSLPFMVDVLLKIFTNIGNNADRFGNLRYHVNYAPDDENTHYEDAKKNVKDIERSFAETIKKGRFGEVKDFYSMGKVNISVIGADNQIMDVEVPGRMVLEQLISSTGLPPFLLGISWSSTERMSAQQADLLTSEIEDYRKVIEPAINHIINWWKRFKGAPNLIHEIKWNDVNLQDQVEEARAELLRQQAREKQVGNIIVLRDQNIIDQDTAAKELGYEKPVGEPPQPETQQQPTTVLNSKKNLITMIEEFESCDCGCEKKDLFSNPNPDPQAQALQVQFTEGFYSEIVKLESQILDYLNSVSNKCFTKSVGDDWEAVDSIIDRLGNTIKSVYRYNISRCWDYGTERANKTTKEDISQQDAETEGINVPESPINISNYEHPYFKQLRDNGLSLLSEKTAELKDEIRKIILDEALRAQGPQEWGRKLNNELGGKRWFWERLARSESAIAFDRADMAEYSGMGIPYMEWVTAPDACNPICKPLNGKMWAIDDTELPQVVYDTHPHCRCRKRPRTLRQARAAGYAA